jgi:hypothetical protein
MLVGETPTLLEVGLTRRGPPTCRHRREWLRHGECAKGRVPPPGEPVKVVVNGRDEGRRSGFSWTARSRLFRLRSRRERPTFHGLGGAQRVSPTSLTSKIKIQHSSIDNSSSVTPLATSRRGAEGRPCRVL